MQTKSKIALAGALLSSAALWGFAESAHAQVNALTVGSFNRSTGEMILTNNRGLVTLPMLNDGPQGDETEVTFNAAQGPVDVSTSTQDNVVRVSSAAMVQMRGYATTLMGYVGSTPINVSGVWRYNGFDDTAVLSGTSSGDSPYILEARGFIYEFNESKPFPDGFTFVPPSTPTPTITPTPTLTPTPSSLNVPELNAARLTLPEPTTQPDHPAAQNNPAANTAPGGQNLRPNGIHTRIMPEWSPGLYQ